MKNKKGQSIAEFALVLPCALLLIFTVIEFALVGVRSIVAQHAAFRTARVAEVYQGEYANAELYAMLHPAIFRGGFVEPAAADGREIAVDVLSKPLAGLGALSPASMIHRISPKTSALPADLSDAELRGGDTPSPYCRGREGYSVCDYPE